MPSTFVLVHGAFANSFSFAPLQAELALLGHRSAAVDLPGHGFEATYPAAYQAPVDLDVGDYYAEPEMASVDAGALAGALRRPGARSPGATCGSARTPASRPRCRTG